MCVAPFFFCIVKELADWRPVTTLCGASASSKSIITGLNINLLRGLCRLFINLEAEDGASQHNRLLPLSTPSDAQPLKGRMFKFQKNSARYFAK